MLMVKGAPDRLLDRASELAAAMADQYGKQPLSYSLHETMLDAIDAMDRSASIERDLLDRFDQNNQPAS